MQVIEVDLVIEVIDVIMMNNANHSLRHICCLGDMCGAGRLSISRCEGRLCCRLHDFYEQAHLYIYTYVYIL